MSKENKEAPRVEVVCAKDGWIQKGEPVPVGEKRMVTEAQAARLKKAGLIKG